jgi:hypothetical protein
MSNDVQQIENSEVDVHSVFDPDRVPLKPILKHPSSRSLDIQSVGISHPVAIHGANEEDGSFGGITWDEPTIAEHDKLRGTRTKITEPKTPYHNDAASASSDDEHSSFRGSSSMEIDKGHSDDASSDGSHHSQKLSPRFALPPSHKKHHHGPGHHDLQRDSHSDHSIEDANAALDVNDGETERALGPATRKVRSHATPLDVGALQEGVQVVKEQRDVDDARFAPTEEDEDDESSDDEFLTPQERAKKDAFAAKRKQHYDEFRRMKEIMSRQNDDEDSPSDSESE